MKLFEEFKEYETMWDGTTNDPKNVIINGIPVRLEVAFTSYANILSILAAKDTPQSGIYIYKRLPTKDKPVPAYYVGKAKNLVARLKAHAKARSRDSVALHIAIRHYDYDLSHFEIGILQFYSGRRNDYKALNAFEDYWIRELHTFENDKDYNLKPGGEGGASVFKVTPEMFELIATLLATTNKTFEDIVREYFIEYDEITGKTFPVISASTVRLINQGNNYLADQFTDQFHFPIRATEEINQIRGDTLSERQKTESELWCRIENKEEYLGTFSRPYAFLKIIQNEKSLGFECKDLEAGLEQYTSNIMNRDLEQEEINNPLHTKAWRKINKRYNTFYGNTTKKGLNINGHHYYLK